MTETVESIIPIQTGGGMLHPSLELLVNKIIQGIDKEKLAELKRAFHNRLRLTQTQPDSTELIEDLWDFFYDWCVFEQFLPDSLSGMDGDEANVWDKLKAGNSRTLFAVTKANGKELRLKDLLGKKTFIVPKQSANDFIGITRGDIIEGRLVDKGDGKEFEFVRRPSYHPTQVHSYIKKKVKEFKKNQDVAAIQNWLWLLVGMYLKHRFYQQMPIEKIYDDNSRI
jgi:hypothetical protein